MDIVNSESLLRIAGSVTERPTGKPASGICVSVIVPGLPGSPDLANAITGKDGSYELVILPEILNRFGLKPGEPISAILRLSDSRGRTILNTAQPMLLYAGANQRVDLAALGLEHEQDWSHIKYIAGQPVNYSAAAKLTAADLIQAYRYFRGRVQELENMNLVRQAFPGLTAIRDPRDDCSEGRLDVIRALLAERGCDHELDGSDADDLPPGTDVHWFYTARVQVKYTTDVGSPHRVDPTLPAADTAVQLSDGTTIGWLREHLVDLDPANTEVAPISIQQVGIIAEYALTQYLSAAFGVRDPRAGAARLEIRMIAQYGPFGGTAASWSHIEIEPANDFLQNLHTVPHEIFHRVQYRYNNTTTRSGIYGLMRDGTCRFIEDCLNDQPNRWAADAEAVFDNPTTSISDSPSVSTVVASSTWIKYGLGVFWKYMAEQHSYRVGAAYEPAVGVDSARLALEATAIVEPGDPGVGYDPTRLRSARYLMPWWGGFDEFLYYDAAKTELNRHETTWGNYLIANYLHGTASSVTDARFDYIEDDDPISWPGSTTAHLADMQALVDAFDNFTLRRGDVINRVVTGFNAWAARYYRVSPDGASVPRLLEVTLNTAAGMTDPLIQILLLGPDNTLVDINRSDQPTYTKLINMEGLTSVVIIVASRLNPGDFTLHLEEKTEGSDTMITRWNSAAGTEYEVSPRGWSWTWISPDIMVDNNNDGLADTRVYFGMNNDLKVRLRNRGNQAVDDIQIDFWYQKATPSLSSASWIPVQDVGGVTQRLTGQSLAAHGDPAAQDVKWFTVHWAPVDDGTHASHWCVKVQVTVLGETNTDNKIALSNFTNVGDSDMAPLLGRLPEQYAIARLIPIPHGPDWTLRDLNLPPLSAHRRIDTHPQTSVGPVFETTRAILVQAKVVQCKLRSWDEKTRKALPQAGRYYPVDPRTLPPGVDPKTLVTVAQYVDGCIVGGVTFQK